jgi:hypothetical protein
MTSASVCPLDDSPLCPPSPAQQRRIDHWLASELVQQQFRRPKQINAFVCFALGYEMYYGGEYTTTSLVQLFRYYTRMKGPLFVRLRRFWNWRDKREQQGELWRRQQSGKQPGIIAPSSSYDESPPNWIPMKLPSRPKETIPTPRSPFQIGKPETAEQDTQDAPAIQGNSSSALPLPRATVQPHFTLKIREEA